MNFDQYKNKTYKANEFLLLTNKIDKITRGRRSAANIQFLHEAVQAGIKFSDFDASGSVVVEKKEKLQKPKAPRANQSEVNNINEEFVRYPGPHGGISNANSVWRVMAGGKEVAKPDEKGHGGLKTICASCGYSLVGHVCDSPAIWDIGGRRLPVVIEGR